MTPADVIAPARKILNDYDVVTPRNSDADLLVFVNDWVKQLAKRVPHTFQQTQDLALVTGVETQEVSRTTTLGLADVLRTSAGGRIRKVPKDQIEDHLRFGYATGAYDPELWCPVEGDNWRFMVYPKPAAATNLAVVVKGDATELLRAYGTQAMAEKGMILPPIYNVPQSINMVANSAEQSVSRTTTFGIVDVTSNATGGRVMKTERAAIEELIRHGAGADPVIWCPVEGDPFRFRVWPVPTSAAALTVVTATQDTKTLLAYANDMREKPMAPHPIFNTTASMNMVANTPHQEVSRTTSLGIVDVVTGAGGKHVRRVTQQQMDDMLRNTAQASPCMWCPIEGDQWRFLVWPVPTTGAALNVITQSRQDTLVSAFGRAFMKKEGIELPDVYNASLSLAMTANSYFQEVSRTTSMGLIDVATNALGKPVRRVEREYINDMMRLSFPAQNTVPEVWSPDPNDPYRFMVYPKPAASTTIKVITVTNPTDVTINAALIPGDDYRASGAHYVAARALMANTSTADSAKAIGLMQLSAQLANALSMDANADK